MDTRSQQIFSNEERYCKEFHRGFHRTSIQSEPNFFGQRLPSNQFWRLFAEFRESIAYWDIETTGLDSWGNSITTSAIYDGKPSRYGPGATRPKNHNQDGSENNKGSQCIKPEGQALGRILDVAQHVRGKEPAQVTYGVDQGDPAS